MATISKGIKLYKAEKALTNLQEIPDLGGESESLEITTLDDSAHMYTDGILNYGEALSFKFLYEKAQFEELNQTAGSVSWKVVLPDNLNCTFTGTASVKLDSVGVNAPLTYTLNIKPDSAMVFGTEA